MAGKKFAAEFALRRNVSALDKILIQDSDDDVVKYAYPPQIAALSGYAYAKSIADLPLMPTNKSIGYIVGQMLYIYVGMGGDTKDGLYQSVGFFVGPQGVQGEKGEQGERGEQGIQGPKGDNGGLSLQEVDAHLATKQYVAADTLAEMLAGYVSNTSLMRDYVTIAKAQDVTGVKNFTAGVQFGGLSMYKSKDDTVYLDANLVVRGGVTMYGSNLTTSPSIFETLPIDNDTIKRNAKGELYAVGGGGSGTGGGGVADSVAWSNVTNKPTWITDTKPKYSYSEILDTPDLSVYAIKSSVDNALSKKADKATTLAGYGITNAYTKSEINNIIDSLDDTYVTIAGEEQSITAEHNFVNGFKVGGLPIKKSQDNTIYLDANLVVSGAITMYGSGSTTFPTIWANIPFDDTMRWDGSRWSVVASTGGGGVADSVAWNNITGKPSWIGSTKPAYSYDEITGKPTTLSAFANDSGFITASASITGNAATATLATYLKTTSFSGADSNTLYDTNMRVAYHSGLPSGMANLPITTGYQNAILSLGLHDNGATAQLYFSRTHPLYYRSSVDGEWRKILDSNNYSEYALPITGGKISGDLEVSGCLYSSVGNLRIKSKVAPMAGVEIAVSDTDYWQISHRSSFANSELHFYHNANGTWSNSVLSLMANGDVATGGNLLAKGAITMYYSSDKRLKQNIRQINASEVLMSLGGVYQYDYIDSEVQKNSTYGGSHYGLIYQNVKGTALSTMCHEREDGFGALNYLDTNFISLIAGATMENISEVEKLKEENKALRRRVEQLEKRIA